MSVSKLNSRAYSSLKKGFSKNSDFRESIKEGNQKMASFLVPKAESQPQTNTSNGEYKKLLEDAQKSYDKKLNNMSKAYGKEMDNIRSGNNKSIKDLQQKLAKSNKMYDGLSKNTQSAISNLGKQVNKQAESIATKNKEQAESKVDSNEETAPVEDFSNSFDPITLATKMQKINALKAERAINNKEVSNVFRNINLTSMEMPNNPLQYEKQNISMGDFQMRLTEGFKVRNWGARKGKHSQGIDARLFKDGRPVDYPMAIADGKIVKIDIHGDGRQILPEEGTKGGVFAYIQLDNNPNKIYKMAHLPISFYQDRNKYINKHVKRGDILIEDNGATGSMTAPHVKYSVADYDIITGKSRMNYSADSNDPSGLFFTGKLTK